jgi:hypothetical protein
LSVLRSILAVLAGMVFIVAVSTGTDLVLCKTIMPEMASTHAPAQDLALALAYRTLYGVIGGWITARLAPGRPITHAVVLGVIGTIASIAGLVVEWSAGQQWYPIALVVLSLPECWLGGKLAARR